MRVLISRKQIRHLYIRVDPRSGQVRVSAPLHVSDAQIRDVLRSRAGWIRVRLASVPSRTVGGEAVGPIMLFGTPVPLQIHAVQRKRSIAMEEGVLTLRVRQSTPDRDRSELVTSWQRSQIRARTREMIAAWEPVLGVQISESRIRRMRTRWGTCNIVSRRIWLNLELICFPIECLEYVIVHEMVHLLERGHNRRFYALMDQFLPNWRAARAILRQSPPAV